MYDEDDNFNFNPDPYFDHDPYNNDYLFKNTHWVMTDFDMWDPNDGIEYPVIELSLVGNIIRDKNGKAILECMCGDIIGRNFNPN